MVQNSNGILSKKMPICSSPKTFKKTYSKLNIHIHFDQKHIDHFVQFRDMFRTKNNFEIPHHKKTMHNPHHLSIHTSKDFC